MARKHSRQRSRIADEIFSDLNAPREMNFKNNVYCLICGERLGVLTHCHAAKHGYERKEAMIAAGMVKVC